MLPATYPIRVPAPEAASEDPFDPQTALEGVGVANPEIILQAVDVGEAVCEADADAQYELPKAITLLAMAVPQAPVEQSRRPLLKSALLQRQARLGVAHPRVEY